MNLTRDVEPLEEIVDELSKELKRRHVNRLRSGECTIEMGFILTDLLTSLERIADHCSNISVCVTQVRENLYDTHSHLDSLKNEPDDSYFNRLEELQNDRRCHVIGQVRDKYCRLTARGLLNLLRAHLERVAHDKAEVGIGGGMGIEHRLELGIGLDRRDARRLLKQRNCQLLFG